MADKKGYTGTERIVAAGFGGQGIMVLGKLLSLAAMKEGKQVTWMPSYGAEVRGGTAHSMTVISDEAIASPVVSTPAICIVMNRPSLLKFKDRIEKGGLLVVNTSLVKDKLKKKGIDVLEVPATDMANDLGNVKVANMVILGALIKKKKIVSIKTITDSLSDIFGSKNKKIVDLNKLAVKRGWEEASA